MCFVIFFCVFVCVFVCLFGHLIRYTYYNLRVRVHSSVYICIILSCCILTVIFSYAPIQGKASKCEFNVRVQEQFTSPVVCLESAQCPGWFLAMTPKGAPGDPVSVGTTLESQFIVRGHVSRTRERGTEHREGGFRFIMEVRHCSNVNLHGYVYYM